MRGPEKGHGHHCRAQGNSRTTRHCIHAFFTPGNSPATGRSSPPGRPTAAAMQHKAIRERERLPTRVTDMGAGKGRMPMATQGRRARLSLARRRAAPSAARWDRRTAPAMPSPGRRAWLSWSQCGRARPRATGRAALRAWAHTRLRTARKQQGCTARGPRRWPAALRIPAACWTTPVACNSCNARGSRNWGGAPGRMCPQGLHAAAGRVQAARPRSRSARPKQLLSLQCACGHQARSNLKTVSRCLLGHLRAASASVRSQTSDVDRATRTAMMDCARDKEYWRAYNAIGTVKRARKPWAEEIFGDCTAQVPAFPLSVARMYSITALTC